MILQILLLFNCLPNVISSQPIFKIVFISIFFILSFHALFFLSSSFYHSFSHFFNIPFEFSLTHLFFLVWFAFPSLLSLSFICSASLKMFSCTSRCFLAYFLFFCSVFFVLFFVLFFFYFVLFYREHSIASIIIRNEISSVDRNLSANKSSEETREV